MPYGVLADAVVFLHFSWIVFLIIGGWWGRRHRAVGVLHVSALVLAFFVETFDWYCPLTHLEVWLRNKGNLGGYRESFITHYINKVIYLDAPRAPIVVMTVLLCLANIWLYLGAGKGKRYRTEK